MIEGKEADDLPSARALTGHASFHVGRRERVVLHTSCAIDEELFGALSFAAEVDSVGLELILKSGCKAEKAPDVLRLFRAFIRQGKTFYTSACALHPRASPLFYYYSFLNLAKAVIALHRPSVFGGKLRHGIYEKYDDANFDNHRVCVDRRGGAFPLLYSLVTTGSSAKPLEFNIAELLHYMSDISYELRMAGYKAPRLLPVKTRLVERKSATENIRWLLLAVAGWHSLDEFPLSKAKLLASFQPVKLSDMLAREVFGIFAESIDGYTFLESRKTYSVPEETARLIPDTRSALGLLYMDYVFKGDWDCYLSLPLSSANEPAMNELLAGYLVFFFLGSLVRYRPDYLERILLEKEAWLIERFVKSCATTVLRHFCCALLDRTLVFINI